MNIIEKEKIRLLKKKIELCKKDMNNKGKFSLFNASFAMDYLERDLDYESLNWFYEVITGWDKYNNIPYDVGVALENLSKDNIVMIHRTKLDLDKNKEGLEYNSKLHNIMSGGLINYGHANAVGGGSFSSEPPELTLTMTPLVGMTGYINLVASYKSNDVTIFAAFPKDLIDKYGHILDDSKYNNIYDLSEYPPKIRTEYMLGALLKKDNGLDEFYTRDEIVNTKEATMKR